MEVKGKKFKRMMQRESFLLFKELCTQAAFRGFASLE
jgi:hypothetical protein